MTDSRKDISVLVADDHVLLSDVLQSYLGGQDDMVVETAPDLKSALVKMKENGGFDVVLLDLQMPGMNGLSGVEQAVGANSNKAVVLFSSDVPRAFFLDAIKRGAKGYIPKTMALRTLTNTIRFIAQGDMYVPPTALLEAEVANESGDPVLSRKEMQVLRGITEGKTNKEIAREMSLSDVTVKMHVRSICAKLDAKNRTQAAMVAKQRRIL